MLILDKDGVPFPDKPIGQQYAEAIARSTRDTKWNLSVALQAGWLPSEFRHWVETGEQPEDCRNFGRLPL